ncbi:ribosome small subunit-dependent GTPase A [Thermodesulfobacteriota bacterium]
MHLKRLGFSEWFEEKLDTALSNSYQIVRVMAVDKESYAIRGENYETRAELTGKLVYSATSPLDFPTVGDWVYAQCFDENTFAIIHEVIPRKTILSRKVPGKKVEFQLVAANVDTAFLVQSLDSNFNLRRLERYLVMTLEAKIRPIVLLSKSDLLSPDEVNDKIQEIHKDIQDVPVYSFSSLSSSGIDAVTKLLSPGETFCLLGSSGVGKTTLINNLLGDEVYDTKTVRESDSRGRHSTTRRQLILLDNGAIMIDTPGMRELGVLSAGSGIDETFHEFTELSANCRFLDCSHTHEKDCAILEAVQNEVISEKRYQNYIKMIKESEHHEKSYLDKRRDDKSFGKMIKTVKKTIKKNKR